MLAPTQAPSPDMSNPAPDLACKESYKFGDKWKPVSGGEKLRLSREQWSATAEELNQKLKQNPNYRLTVRWTLEEESE